MIQQASHTLSRCVHVAALLLFLAPQFHLVAQFHDTDPDPCGHHLMKSADGAQPLVWSYGLDALLTDLQNWSLSPSISIDVIGHSVRGIPLYHVVLTNPASSVKKKRIWIHARTHPIESESSWVARAIINELLSGSALATSILDNCIVHVLPMLNPDGVQLLRPRENANGIDIESNWSAAQPEPEVVALRRHLELLMASSSPIDVALNLHSAFQCRRYFVYHDPAGTSELFASRERRFIDMVRARFPGGIEPYDYFVTWTGGTPDRYPESWFWLNFAERVMALTYEDMNCATSGEFERTARALLGGAMDYMGSVTTVHAAGAEDPLNLPSVTAVYPQPFSAASHDRLHVAVRSLASGGSVRVHVLDALGRLVARLWDGHMSGSHTLDLSAADLTPGVHFIRLEAAGKMYVKPFQVLR